jgi:hypothetical protein
MMVAFIAGVDAPSSLLTPKQPSSQPVRRYRSLTYGIVIAVAAAAALALVLFVGETPTMPQPVAELQPGPAAAPETPQLSPASALTRPVFPYSIVPGGVLTPAEVERAIARDPVVAAHYAGLDPRALRVVRLQEPRQAYVSYRIGNQVYWTRKKLSLKAGETVLTDGKMTVRARCGNQVADAVLGQTSAAEPSEQTFDAPTETVTIARDQTAAGGSGVGGTAPAAGAVPAAESEWASVNSMSPRQGPVPWPIVGGRQTPGVGGESAGADPGPGGSTPSFSPTPNPNPGPNFPPEDGPRTTPDPKKNPDPTPDAIPDPGPDPKPGPKAGPDPGPDPKDNPRTDPPGDPEDGPVPVPEPTTLILVGIGAGGAVVRHLHKRKSARR